MLKNKDIISNSIANIISTIPQFIISVLTSFFINTEFFGKYVYFMAISYLISIPINFGYSIIGLIYIQKRYFNILNLYIFFSLIVLLLIFPFFLLVQNGFIYYFSIFYILLNYFKELINYYYVVNFKLISKIKYNLLDLIFVIIVIIIISKFYKTNPHNLLFLFLGFLFFKIFVIYIFFKEVFNKKNILYYFKKINFKNFKFVYISSFFNQLNILFTNIYSQGYFILLGLYLSYEIVSIVKYINLIQTLISIIFNSFIQIKTKIIVNYNFLKRDLFRIILISQIIQVGLSLVSFFIILIISKYFNIPQLNTLNNLFLFAMLFSYFFAPSKQILGLNLVASNSFKSRTIAIILSVLISLPFLFLVKTNIFFVPTFVISVDILAVLLFILILKNYIKYEGFNNSQLVRG